MANSLLQEGVQKQDKIFLLARNSIRWLEAYANAYSGFRNAQMAGISEYFRFEVPALGEVEQLLRSLGHRGVVRAEKEEFPVRGVRSAGMPRG